jgi:Asp-tRNA(Asn)/Glu-tRNA(Gln) amidotransferase C subunit
MAMPDGETITPEAARRLARWAGMRETQSPERLAEIFEGVRQVVERLYAVDVEGFEADFLQPDARAR